MSKRNHAVARVKIHGISDFFKRLCSFVNTADGRNYPNFVTNTDFAVTAFVRLNCYVAFLRFIFVIATEFIDRFVGQISFYIMLVNK